MSNDIPAGPPTPGSEHALLKPFEGTFRAAVSLWTGLGDSMMQLERGTMDATGRIWTMLSSFLHPHIGQHVTKKSVIRLIDNDHNDMTTWMTRLDGNEVRTMHIDFVRS